MNKKILIYGIGTYKNNGVRAIIDSTLKQINKENEITITTYDYDNNKKYYKNDVTYINHYKQDLTEEEKKKEKELYADNNIKGVELLHQKEVVDIIPDMDICLSAGGDNYSYGESNWLYAIDEEIKRNSKKLVLWGASLYETIKEETLIKDLYKFDILLMRETLSYEALKKFIPEEKLILAPDPAFSLETEKIELNEFYKTKNIVGINLSPLTIPEPIKGNERFDEVINLINYILENTNMKIALIPHVTTDGCNDMTTLQAIYNEFINEKRVYLESSDFNCNQIKYIISNCKMLIAARTHASIAAYSSCIPTLVIGYSVKSKGISKDLFGTDENYVINSEKVKNGNLIEHFKWLNANKEKIAKHLSEIMPKIKDDASHLFDKVIERLEENSKKQICEKDKCLGCGLCASLCKTSAITMEEDTLGFKYPKINNEKCIDCHLCKNICPINRESKINEFEPICYAAKNKDNAIRKKSTSGGIFTILAETMIDNYGGIIYGGGYKKGTHTEHIRITNKKDLEKVRGSKYTWSDMSNIYEKILEDKKQNKWILFSGTPCQVGVIQNLLKDYKKIIYVSVICHGVMSEKLVNRYLNEEFKNKKIINLEYRYKDVDARISSIKIETEDESITTPFKDNTIMGMYLLNTNLRESCYDCKYKGQNNNADIIIGDYWGAENYHREICDNMGISALIINTKQGEKFIKDNKLLDLMTYEETKYENIVIGNSALVSSIVKSTRRYTLANDITKQSLSEIYNYDLLKEKCDTAEKLKLMYETKARELETEYNSIINSIRWKLINKLFSLIPRRKK